MPARIGGVREEVRIMLTVTLVGAIIAALFLGLLAIGPDRVWRLIGRADLGDVAFETLQRRTSPNDALACPPDLCTAKVDLVPPDFPVPARDLRAAFARAIADEPRVETVADDAPRLTARYIQRSALLRYPDTIVVRFIDRPDGRSTIALYSRSQLGRSDFGVNRARLVRWLGKLSAEIAPAT